MSNVNIVRAWKDAEYRNSLSAEEQALLPEHPAGAIELADADLEQIQGADTQMVLTAGCCPTWLVTILNPAGCIARTVTIG